MSFNNPIDDSCGVNPLSNMMKQFTQDKSLQREQWNGSSQAGPSSMRTQQRAAPIENDLTREFFSLHEPHPHPKPLFNPFEFSALRQELEAPQSWTQEFQHHQAPVLTEQERGMMDALFTEHQLPKQGWVNEFEQFKPDQQAKFEEAYDQHTNWANQFDSWQSEFDAQKDNQLYDDDAIAKQVELAAIQTDFDHVWDQIQDDLSSDNRWDYQFERQNRYLNQITFEAALDLMSSGALLQEVALAFEAVVQAEPRHAEAWMYLGQVQNQNEKEGAGLRALERAVEIDPSLLPALMGLAISYINEGYEMAADQALERWITLSYPDVVEPVATSIFDLHERVTDLFLKAARLGRDEVDPDVQVGLGVLFFSGKDFDKAIDCFAAAVKIRPNDYLLWNRMGATLASGGRLEEAIEAYHKALELRPSFVRARYNIGICCIRMGCYKEAAEHMLTCISMNKDNNQGEGVNVSDNCWDMLRKALTMMDRRDLVNKAVVGTNLNEFRPEFEF